MGHQLIVFDCDGVLVDSEVLVVEVEAELLTEAGFPITVTDIVDRFVGLSYGLMMSQLGAEFGRPVPPELRARIEEAALDRLEASVKPVPGMETVLQSVATAGLARCVASSSDLDRVRMSLRVAGLDRWFDDDLVFSAQMVDRPKPAPDVFLLAAATAGFEPTSCLVVEDSPHGVEAAVAAGMDVVGLVAGGHVGPSLGQRLHDAGAARVVETTAELEQLLVPDYNS